MHAEREAGDDREHERLRDGQQGGEHVAAHVLGAERPPRALHHLARRDHRVPADEAEPAGHLEQRDGADDDGEADPAGTGHRAASRARIDWSRSAAQIRPVIAPKAGVRDDAAVALAPPAGLDEVDEHARACRHHADAVGQQGRLVEGVGDQQDGGAGLAP